MTDEVGVEIVESTYDDNFLKSLAAKIAGTLAICGGVTLGALAISSGVAAPLGVLMIVQSIDTGRTYYDKDCELRGKSTYTEDLQKVISDATDGKLSVSRLKNVDMVADFAQIPEVAETFGVFCVSLSAASNATNPALLTLVVAKAALNMGATAIDLADNTKTIKGKVEEAVSSSKDKPEVAEPKNDTESPPSPRRVGM